VTPSILLRIFFNLGASTWPIWPTIWWLTWGRLPRFSLKAHESHKRLIMSPPNGQQSSSEIDALWSGELMLLEKKNQPNFNDIDF